jgi:predicted metalloprotease with PDZ domain
MKATLAMLAAAFALVALAHADASRKCEASAKDCELQIREMLAGKRYLGAKFEESRWGMVIAHVEPDSPAAVAGLNVSDRVFAVNGKEATKGGFKRFKALLNEAAAKEGGRVYFTIIRVGRVLRIAVRMTVMSKEAIDKVVAAHLKEAHPEIGN